MRYRARTKGTHMRSTVREPFQRVLLAIALVAAMGAALAAAAPSASATGHCQSTPTGLTAHYINQAPNGPLDVECDIGIFIDEGMKLNNVQLNGLDATSTDPQYGIYVDGADVDVNRATVEVDAAFSDQFVSIAYQDGATGTIRNSDLSGAHRVGILLRGEATDVKVVGSSVTGTGAKTSGWAENGIQVDPGVTAEIVNNTVAGHWWDGESNWASTGIMLFTSDSRVTNNTLVDNEFAIYVAGDGNDVKGNRTSSDVVSNSSFDFKAYGLLIAGASNHVAGNHFTSADGTGAVGIYEYSGSDSNRFTGNRIRAFEFSIYAGGTDSMVRGTPAGVN